MLVVALSDDIRVNEQDELLPSELNLRLANATIRGADIEEPDLADGKNVKYIEESEHFEENWRNWATSIFVDSKKMTSFCTSGSVVNAFYAPDVAAKIKDVMAYLPLWTGVMRPIFGLGKEIASSSDVEAEFSMLKNRVLKNLRPMRADKFVMSHVDYLDGRLRLEIAAFRKSTTDEEDETNEMQIQARENESKKISMNDANFPPVFDISHTSHSIEDTHETSTIVNESFS